jgi:ribosomal protein S18 acetylase RimI-like enzyme
VHPIEQLRYVARATGADAGLLVQEAASALRVFAHEPAGLLTASRRLLSRQPAVGPLWWLCARLVMSPEPWAESRAALDALARDRTPNELAGALPDGAVVVIVGWPDQILAALPRRGDLTVLVIDVDGQGLGVARRLDRAEVTAEVVDASRLGGAVDAADLVLLEAAASGDAAALVDPGSLPAAATARAAGRPVWLVTGEGRRLPEPFWQAVAERTAPSGPRWLADHEVLGLGLVDRFATPDGVVTAADRPPSGCPFAPELLLSLA